MKIFNALTLFLLASAGLLQGQSEQQSLGDVARQNKPEKKAVRVIGEDDFTPAREVSVTSGASSSTSDGKTADSKAKTGGPNQPSSANNDVARLKTQLQQLKDEREGWKRSAKEYEAQLETEGNGFRRETYEKALSNDKQNAEICQQKIDQAQADLAKAEKAAGSSQKTASQPATNRPSQQ